MNQTDTKHTSKEERLALYKEWQASGLSKKEFCRQKPLNYQTFIWWFSKKKAKQESKGKFVPVTINKEFQASQSEIHLSVSRKVILSGTVNTAIIQAIVKG